MIFWISWKNLNPRASIRLVLSQGSAICSKVIPNWSSDLIPFYRPVTKSRCNRTNRATLFKFPSVCPVLRPLIPQPCHSIIAPSTSDHHPLPVHPVNRQKPRRFYRSCKGKISFASKTFFHRFSLSYRLIIIIIVGIKLQCRKDLKEKCIGSEYWKVGLEFTNSVQCHDPIWLIWELVIFIGTNGI